MSTNIFENDKFINVIIKGLSEHKKNLEKAFDIDFKEWEVKIRFDKLVDITKNFSDKKYLPQVSKEIIIDGFGKIVLISNQNPYLIFNFILSSIYTNNSVDVILTSKMLASNKVIIEVLKEILASNGMKKLADKINYKEFCRNEDVVNIQDNYDLLYYFGNKTEYFSFIKRIHIESKFENFGEIYVYVDDKEFFKKELLEIDKFSYLNDLEVIYYYINLQNSIEEINKLNNVNKISVIFTKNAQKAYDFIKNIKSENVYFNLNPCEEFSYEIDLQNLVYRKRVSYKK